ncbi:MAG: hypothetical protein AAF600_22495 [Bacteroidota bacterium]
MLTQNGQTACLNGKNPESSSFSLKSISSSEAEFIGNIRFQGIEDLVHSLKTVHDYALYHTDLCFDRDEKTALFNLKILWEGLEKMVHP